MSGSKKSWEELKAEPGKKPWGQLKLKEVPGVISKEMTLDKLEKRLKKNCSREFLLNYHKKHIQTGSIRPLNHVLISVGLLSYAIGWPTELRHLRHAEEKALTLRELEEEYE